MTDQPTTSKPTPNATQNASGAQSSNEQSTIQFPYGDLEDAIAVASGVMKWGGTCEPDQLSTALNQTPTSGSFKNKVATAKIFGLIEMIQGKYQLTDLGFAITDASRSRAAKVDAFLKVPLYRKVYDDFRNRQLPPRPVALEHAFVGFGVAPKQKDRARQAFDRSAQQAGFFDQGGRDRLVRPPIPALDTPGNVAPEHAQEQGTEQLGGHGPGGGTRPPPAGLHPFIQGLLQTLPQPGTVWAIEGRVAWLKAAAQNFTLMYKGDGTIDVTTAPAPQARRAAAE